MLSPQLHGRALVRWGIIGCGDVTEVKSGPGFQRAAGAQLVAVMRRDGARAADYARRHGVPRWYDDARALVADPEVDAVYVATPPDTHGDYACLAARAGKPVYVEKPMARHVPECDRMLAASAAAGQKLFVAYYRRALPRFERIRRHVAAGGLGRVTGVWWRLALPKHLDAPAWRTDVAIAGGGHFLDLAAHGLDLLDHWFGPLEAVRGAAARRATPGGAEDHAQLTFTAGGVPGAVLCNFAAAIAEDLLCVTGTEGELRCAVLAHDAVQVRTADSSERWETAAPPHIAQPLIQTVVDDLLGRGTCPSTGASARRTSAVMDAVLEGYYGGRADAFWSRPDSWPGRAEQAGD